MSFTLSSNISPPLTALLHRLDVNSTNSNGYGSSNGNTTGTSNTQQSFGVPTLLGGLRSSTLYLMFLAELNSIALYHRWSATDVQPIIRYSVRTFQFSTTAAQGLWGGAQLIARFIHCAAHGIDLSSRLAHFIPAHIPIAALRDVGLPMPAISLLLGYPDNPIPAPSFPYRVSRDPRRRTVHGLGGVQHILGC
ncbi:hypothetical protein C8J57DRAFT_1221975 [Mycena rebaudengoi]|nr:hypothetical protein C8J57DRAFT_1221975 [Mycena rebaudengoi]